MQGQFINNLRFAVVRDKMLNIQIDGKSVDQVENFIYLGGMISETTSENDTKRRVGLASMGGAMQKLKSWTSKDINYNSTRVLALPIAT